MISTIWTKLLSVALIILIMIELCMAVGFIVFWSNFLYFVKAYIATCIGLAACLLSLPASIKISIMRKKPKDQKKTEIKFDKKDYPDDLKQVKIEQTITFDPCPYPKGEMTNMDKQTKLKRKKEQNAKTFMSVLLVISLIAHLIALGLLIIFMAVANNINRDFTDYMKMYKTDVNKKIIIDDVQIGLQCCGLDEFKDWFTIDWTGSAIVLQKETPMKTHNKFFNESGPTTVDCLEEGVRWDTVPYSCCKMIAKEPCMHRDLDQLGPSTINCEGCRENLRSRMMTVYLIPAFLHILIVILLFSAIYPFTSCKKLSERARKNTYTQFNQSRRSSPQSSLPDICMEQDESIKTDSEKPCEPCIKPISPPCLRKERKAPKRKKDPRVIRSCKMASMATTTPSAQSEDTCMVVTTDTSISNICKPCPPTCEATKKKKKSKKNKKCSKCSKKSKISDCDYEQCIEKCKKTYCRPSSESSTGDTTSYPAWMKYANCTESSQTAELRPSSHEEHVVYKHRPSRN